MPDILFFVMHAASASSKPRCVVDHTATVAAGQMDSSSMERGYPSAALLGTTPHEVDIPTAYNSEQENGLRE